MKITKYPDGTSYVDVKDMYKEKFEYRINSYEDLWILGQILEAINHRGVKPTVTIPNLIDAQADARFGYAQSFGLKNVLNFLNGFKAKYKIFHPHNESLVTAMLDDVEIIDNRPFIVRAISDLYPGPGFVDIAQAEEKLILMSADAGGFKPLMKLCKDIDWKGETYSASKARYVTTIDGKITSNLMQIVDRADFGGKDIMIIDDISIYGGTFKGLAKILRKRNIGKLYLAVSHITMQKLGSVPVTRFFEHVYTTNSKFNTYYARDSHGTGFQPDKMTVINLFNQ